MRSRTDFGSITFGSFLFFSIIALIVFSVGAHFKYTYPVYNDCLEQRAVQWTEERGYELQDVNSGFLGYKYDTFFYYHASGDLKHRFFTLEDRNACKQ